jgi:hypothetical protein
MVNRNVRTECKRKRIILLYILDTSTENLIWVGSAYIELLPNKIQSNPVIFFYYSWSITSGILWYQLIRDCHILFLTYNNTRLRSFGRASWKILIIKPTRCTNFSNLYWNETLHVSESSSVYHQKVFTAHTTNMYDIYHFCVYSEKVLMMDRGTVRNI